jgi:hypothetical protein
MGGRGPIRVDFALDKFQDSSLCAGGLVHILLIQVVFGAEGVNPECRGENYPAASIMAMMVSSALPSSRLFT